MLTNRTFELAKRNFDINRGIEAYLKEVGTLLIDPDVVYSLENTQQLGRVMHAQQQPHASKTTTIDNPNDNVETSVGNLRGTNLFPPRDLLALSDIKQEQPDGISLASDGSGVLCTPSPVAGTMFPGKEKTHSRHCR